MVSDFMFQIIMGYIEEVVCPNIWKDRKSEFKDMTRRELVNEAVIAGAETTLDCLKNFEKYFAEPVIEELNLKKASKESEKKNDI